MSGDNLEPVICDCGSKKVVFEQGHGYYHCLDCDEVWAFDDDDPDYDEMILPDEYTEGFPYPEIKLGRKVPDGD
jgi:hypothetical protein